jgi:CRP/FNR family transcriptional regulator, cyclic AMP receptor protein
MAGYDEGVYRTYLAQVPMFKACTSAQIQELSELADGLAVDPDQVLVREGESGDEFFVLGSGEAVVSRAGKEVDRLGPGDFFGELALFDGTPRNATVTSTTGVTLVGLNRDAFQKLLGDAPAFRDAVLKGMAQRLHELDAKA